MKQISIALFILFITTGQAFGKCASWTKSDANAVKTANEIFVAEITAAHVENDKYGAAEKTHAVYRLIDTIKGKPAATGHVDSVFAVPGMALTPGYVYLFFIYKGSTYVDWCGGTRVLNEYYVPYKSDDIKLIEHLKEIVKKQSN